MVRMTVFGRIFFFKQIYNTDELNDWQQMSAPKEGAIPNKAHGREVKQLRIHRPTSQNKNFQKFSTKSQRFIVVFPITILQLINKHSKCVST